jgi:hypothetical protein
MSEYQFYEFKSIDKPLTQIEKDEIGSWSSRTNASNTGAIFTYSYSDFPKDTLKVIEKYFDAMFYISNWGTKQLIFKLPNSLVDVNKLKQYCSEGLNIIEKPDFILVNFCIDEEEGGGNWIEGEGWLSSLSQLREDIISGDYRCLYLIWLKINTEYLLNDWGNVEPESTEPNVPANLQTLNGALMDFVDIFEIDNDAITIASENSFDTSDENSKDYSEVISKLSDNEKNDILKRLLQNEPLLSIKFRKLLKNITDKDKVYDTKKSRTIGELAKAISKLKEQRIKEEKRKQEEKRLEELKKIENEEDFLWDRVDLLIYEKNTKSYDEAIKLLKDLKKLAIYKEKFNNFCDKIENIKLKNTKLSALKSRIEQAKLITE